MGVAMCRKAARAERTRRGALGDEHEPEEGAGGAPARGKRRAAAAAATARRSPNAHAITPLELAARHIAVVYDALVNSGSWDARFRRGRRPNSPVGLLTDRTFADNDNDTAVRSLATTYLAHAATDAWNVVAGAVELARVWAFKPDVRCPASAWVEYSDADADVLDRRTRLRLSVCLSISWKFARNCQTVFSREFAASDGSCYPRTLELAFTSFNFLLPDEQDLLGDWDVAHAGVLRELQTQMLDLEVELLLGVHTFPLLVENAQSVAELKLQEFFDAKGVSERRCMQMRGLLPFFVRASLFKRAGEPRCLYAELLADPDPRPAAAALLCAAWLAIKHSGAPARDMRAARDLFDAADRVNAWRLLDNGARAVAAKSDFFRRGCYGDRLWYGYDCVTYKTLTNATNACLPTADAADLAALGDDLPPALEPPHHDQPNTNAAAQLLRCVTRVCSW